MPSTIHEDVKAALEELKQEAHDLEQVAGHELVTLYNALRGTTQRIKAARRGEDAVEPTIEAGAGAITDPLHPETAAAEEQPQTRERLERQIAKEPDLQVRDQLRGETSSTDADELKGEQLDKRAAELDIEGRSEMTADEKRKAVKKAEKQ